MKEGECASKKRKLEACQAEEQQQLVWLVSAIYCEDPSDSDWPDSFVEVFATRQLAEEFAQKMMTKVMEEPDLIRKSYDDVKEHWEKLVESQDIDTWDISVRRVTVHCSPVTKLPHPLQSLVLSQEEEEEEE